MRITLHCHHADTCLPCYWSGHHRAHVQVPVYRGMSPRAVRDAIRDELRQGAVAGSDKLARLLAADLVLPEDEKLADAVTLAAYAAVRRDVVPAKKGARRLFLDLEPQGDDDESVYAFFVFVPDETCAEYLEN